MKKLIISIVLIAFATVSFSQTTADIFKYTDYKYTWLGVDYSHVKLIGDFVQFGEAGEQDPYEIRDDYFPGWNRLILNEPDKYDIKGMFKLNDLSNDIDMIMALNAKTDLNEMAGDKTPDYSADSIGEFVKAYDLEGKEDLGIVFVAESMNKEKKEAYYHIVVLDMSNSMVLFSERMRGEPRGFGLRNYWAGSIYEIIKSVKKKYYKEWKSKYGK